MPYVPDEKEEAEQIPQEPSGSSLTQKRKNQADGKAGATVTWEAILKLLQTNTYERINDSTTSSCRPDKGRKHRNSASEGSKGA